LNLPLNFDVELDTKLLIEEAVSALIARAGYDEKLTNYLVQYVEHQASEERETRIQVVISKLAEILFNDSYSAFRNALNNTETDELFSFSDEVKSRTQILYERLHDLGKTALDLIESRGLTVDDFYYKKTGIYGYFVKVKDVNIKGLLPGARSITTVEEDKWSGKNNIPAIEEIKDDLKSIFYEIREIVPEYISLYMVRKNLESTVLLGEVNRELESYYRENSVIHLSETVNKVAEVVQSEEMPFIYERIGEKYNHYLIDEFQDTSVVQWNNLLPLVENSLAEGKFNLLVGDAKQSIYRWRGGDFRQFVNLPEVVTAGDNPYVSTREETLKRNYKEVILDSNYRSAKQIVDFNNDFYEFIKQNSGNEIVKEVFKDHRQKAAKDMDGYMEICKVPALKTDESVLAGKIVSVINDLKARNYKYGDITILARKNRNLSYISDILLDEGIPIVSSDSLFLSSSVYVSFIMNFLRWTLNPSDGVSKTAVLFFLSANGYERKISGTFNSSLELLKNIFPDYHFDEIFNSGDTLLIIEALSENFGFYQKDFPYIMHLLEFVKKSEVIAGQGIANFLEYSERYFANENIAMPEGLDAVNLMTIHKSKGLQFKVVIFIDIGGKNNSRSPLPLKLNAIGIKKPEYGLVPDENRLFDTFFKKEKEFSDSLSVADNINVLYVATTRASREMFLIYEEKTEYSTYFDKFTALAENGFETIDEKTIGLGSKELYVGQSDKDSGVEKQFDISGAGFSSWMNRLSRKKRFMFSEDDKRAEGIKIHNLLSGIKSTEDIDKVISDGIASGNINNEEAENFRAIIENIFTDNVAAGLFDASKEIINERTFIDSAGKFLRPDRIVIDGDTVTVVDYKYSGFDDVSERDMQKYIEQVSGYVALLKEVFPDKKINGKLLWLKNKIVLQDV